MGRVGWAGFVFVSSVLVVACGGSTAGGDGGADATLPDAADASASDAPSDAPLEAGGDASCGALAPAACTQCCIAAAGGTGGFELLYNQPCTTCASCGPNVRPCGTNMSPPAGAGCILCLRPSLMQGQPWSMCQQSAQCKAFVECFATCPTM
jgi:hypothetical protein